VKRNYNYSLFSSPLIPVVLDVRTSYVGVFNMQEERDRLKFRRMKYEDNQDQLFRK
jgi:hypothetical protein